MPYSGALRALIALLLSSVVLLPCDAQLSIPGIPQVDISKLGLPAELPLVTDVSSLQDIKNNDADKSKPAELSPFCNSNISSGTGPYDADNCASFAEQEVDMILLLMDLLAKDVPSEVATAFYSEIRCLSRRNIVTDKKGLARVCFRQDYSKVVGELLAKYIKPLIPDSDKSTKDSIPTVSRVSNDEDVDNVFKELNSESDISTTEANSCCTACYTDRYFPYLGYEMCVKTPNGDHCCHTVCKALERVKIGMDTSVTYCCPQLYPQPCWF